MKNIFYENIKRNFKRACHRNWTFVNKIYCHHSFENITPNDLTWWANFGFMLNNYYVSVAWEHPRMQYSDQINNAANEQVQHLYDEDGADNIFNDAKPNYIKVGKSRKKISSYSTEVSDSKCAWFKALQAAKEKLKKEADFIITPNIKVEWVAYGKDVTICAPVEIRSIEDVALLSLAIKRLLKYEININEAFNANSYTRKNWLSDMTLQ